jgi:glycerate-2-kinase
MLFKNREEIISNGQTPALKKVRQDILDILCSAIDAVDPYNAVKKRFDQKMIVFDSKTIDLSSFENIYLVGFGKASVGMTSAVCDSVKVAKGVVVTSDPDNKVEDDNVITFVGGHPIPSQISIDGADEILKTIKMCGEDDLLIVLISGGGSALLCKPRVGLKEIQVTTDLLLHSGADINEINTIRKHLSMVKGGQLVKDVSCTVVSFIISDIVGDPMSFIASGPTYPDSTTYKDAQGVLKKYNLWGEIPIDVKMVISEGINGKIPETLKKGNLVFNNVFNFIVANNEIACKAAKVKSEELGYNVMILTTSLTGEAKDIGRFLVGKAKNYLSHGKKFVFISGGETTVTIKGNGRGGRNQEMILGSIEELDGSDLVFASFATDGIDGKSDAAGGIVDSTSLNRASEKNLNPEKFLVDNNSYVFLKNLNDLFFTGPTGTNVMDIQIIIKNG